MIVCFPFWVNQGSGPDNDELINAADLMELFESTFDKEYDMIFATGMKEWPDSRFDHIFVDSDFPSRPKTPYVLH